MIVFWGIVCAFVAMMKNRSVLGWFCLGILLNVFGFIILIFMSDKPKQ